MRVLLAIDESDVAEEVAAAAAHLLDADDEVHLLTVINPHEVHETIPADGSIFRSSPVPYPLPTGGLLTVNQPQPAPVERTTQAAERVEGTRRRELEALAHRYLRRSPVQVHVEFASDIAGHILSAAERLEVHGIAMGTHGRGGVAHALVGSVAEQVIRRSPVPVLVVRQGLHVPRLES